MNNYIKILKKRTRSHKRHFQLLELMVAAFILLVCIAPTMRIFTSMYQSQLEIIRENQRDHLVHLIHAKVTELLYKRQVHIGQGNKEHTIHLSDSELNDELKKYSYAFSGTLVIVDSHKSKNEDHPDKYLAQLTIKLKDISPRAQKKQKKFENQDPAENFYDYYIYIDAGCKDSRKRGEETEKNGDDKKEDNKNHDDEDDDEADDESSSDPDDINTPSPTQPHFPSTDNKKVIK